MASDTASTVPLRRRAQPEDPSAGPADVARPFGVYVHFPFCGVRCPYCDFAVDERYQIPHDGYADAVSAELHDRAGWFRDGETSPSLRSIYFGGGTPGLWRPDALGRVVNGIVRAFATNAAALEITVEVNPGEVDEPHLRALREIGVNRLSIGAQSFDDNELVRLGRNHTAAAIPTAFAAARAAGFDNLTADLMFAIPGQTPASWARSLAALVALGPEHVSAYSLTIEKGTRFFNDVNAARMAAPDDDLAAEMFQTAQTTLAAAGYAQYEISSHARPGRRAVHNQLYWTGGAYLGLGASAASFRPLRGGGGWRFSNPRGTDVYLRSAGTAEGSRLAKVERRTPSDLENEALWLALRTIDGVDRAAHAMHFGQDPLATDQRQRSAVDFARRGWLIHDEARVRLTPQGLLFADEIAASLWA